MEHSGFYSVVGSTRGLSDRTTLVQDISTSDSPMPHTAAVVGTPPALHKLCQYWGVWGSVASHLLSVDIANRFLMLCV